VKFSRPRRTSNMLHIFARSGEAYLHHPEDDVPACKQSIQLSEHPRNIDLDVSYVQPFETYCNPYCNRTDTDRYAADKRAPQNYRIPPKQAEEPDAPVRAGTYAPGLKIMVSPVRFRVPPLEKILQNTRKSERIGRAAEGPCQQPANRTIPNRPPRGRLGRRTESVYGSRGSSPSGKPIAVPSSLHHTPSDLIVAQLRRARRETASGTFGETTSQATSPHTDESDLCCDGQQSATLWAPPTPALSQPLYE
jgi:hypothetical protein